MSTLKRKFLVLRDCLAFVSLLLGLFLTFRDKLQINLGFLSWLLAIPYLSTGIVVVLCVTSIGISLFILRRRRLPRIEVSKPVDVPFYQYRTRRLARLVFTGALVLLPILAITTLIREAYSVATSAPPTGHLEMVEGTRHLDLFLRNDGTRPVFITGIEFRILKSTVAHYGAPHYIPVAKLMTSAEYNLVITSVNERVHIHLSHVLEPGEIERIRFLMNTGDLQVQDLEAIVTSSGTIGETKTVFTLKNMPHNESTLPPKTSLSPFLPLMAEAYAELEPAMFQWKTSEPAVWKFLLILRLKKD